MSSTNLSLGTGSHIDKLINANYQPSPSKPIYSDRFIPSRTGSNFSLFDLSPSETAESGGTYSTLLKSVMFGPNSSKKFDCENSVPSAPRNIFKYKTETRMPMNSLSPFGDELPAIVPNPAKTLGQIPRSAYSVLDAPGLQDDFYLNLVDWSSHNMVAVALGSCVYIWNACNSRVTKLCDLGTDDHEHDSLCSVGWAKQGTHLAIGTLNGKVQIWDATRCKRIRDMEGHRLQVGALAWSSSLLSSGSRDWTILQRDIRVKEDFVSKLSSHRAEVCGLKWSYDNRELASGGNDNKLFIWNQHSGHPAQKYCDHTAAVKAIAWSPHQNGLLASGGGTKDNCIRFWNTTTSSRLGCVDTGSQVCSLAWSKNVNQLVSTHGYSRNQINVWRYPSMSKLATLTGHKSRVLYLAISPDGQTIITGAGDETLRLWNVFPSRKSQKSDTDFGASSLGRTQIR